MRQNRPAAVVIASLAVIALVLLIAAFRSSGNFLVTDNRAKSDAIVITQGDDLDSAYWMGLRLVMEGYGGVLLMDARTDQVFFGHSQAELAAEFIAQTAGGVSDRVKVCPITADTTAEETYEVDRCLKRSMAHSVLLLSADFHTRRSLAIFSRLLPRYRWSVAPVPDERRFNPQWWRKRAWIRTAVVEWEHLVWWELLDRWRFVPVTGR